MQHYLFFIAPVHLYWKRTHKAMDMNISLELVDNGYGLQAKSGEHTMMLDAAQEIGGSDQGMRPLSLMLISLAGCSSMDILYVLRKGRHQVHSYKAQVHATRREEHPRIFNGITLQIEVATSAPDAVLERAAELARTKYCSAFAILEASGPVELKVVRSEE